MAQDILITPGSGEPQILFRGSGTNDTPIELNVLSSYQSANGSGTALLFEGTEGQLFAITDNLSSGVIFSVAGAAGLPFIEADASGDVRLIEYGRYVGVGTGTPAYQLDVFGTGRFSEGILFADGSVQTGAYTGDGGGGTTYTAGSGLTLDGTEFNIYGGTGQFKQVLFESDLVQIGSAATANGTESISIGGGAGTNSNGATNLIAIGGNAGNAATSANIVVAIGDDACASSQGLVGTNAIGYFAGASASGTGNNYMGAVAGGGTLGDKNVGIGNNALEGVNGSTNIEIVAYGIYEVSPSIIGNNSNKIHIGRTLIGDTSSRLYAIGNVGASNLTPDATLEILPKVSTDIGLIVQGATSQSANLQEWQDSAGTLLTSVNEDGYIEIGTGTVSATRSFIVHTGSAYFPNTVYIGEQYTTVGAAGPDGRIYINGYNYAGLEFNSHSASSETAGWTHHRVYQGINSALIFDDSSTVGNEGFQFTMSAGSVSNNATVRIQDGMGFGSTANMTSRNEIGSRFAITNVDGRMHDIELSFRTGVWDNTLYDRFIFTREGDFSATGNINALYGTVTASSGVFNTGEINKLTVDNGTASAFNVSGTSLLAGTGVVLQVKNTGGDTLFAVEDTNETTVVVNAQVGQTSYPFEVRDEFGITAAYVDVSGNVSGNSISFGDGTTQTTASTPTTGTASGIAFFGDDNLLTTSTGLVYDDSRQKISVIGSDTTGLFMASGSTNLQIRNANGSQLRYIGSDGHLFVGNHPSFDLRTYIDGGQNNISIGRLALGNRIDFAPFGGYVDIIKGSASSCSYRFNDDTAIVRDGAGIVSLRKGASTPHELRIYASGNSNSNLTVPTDYARLSIQASNYDYIFSPEVNNSVAGSIIITNDTSSQEILVVKGAVSQSANLQEWQDSSAGVLAYVDNQGMISGTGITYSDGTSQTSLFATVETNANSGITLSCSSHAGKYIRCTHAVSVDITIPSGLSCYDYTEYMFEQAGAGQISVTGDAGVTLNTSSSAKSRTQYSVITIKKVAADTYTVFGDVE